MSTDTSPISPDYRTELAEGLRVADLLRERMEDAVWSLPVSPREASDFLRALDADNLLLAQWLFITAAQAAMRQAAEPTLDQRAAAIVANRLANPPGADDDQERWRVAMPSVHARPKHSPPPARELQWQCCSFVWGCLADGMEPDNAMQAAATEFSRGLAWVKAAYYGVKRDGYAGRRALQMQGAMTGVAAVPTTKQSG